MGVKVEVWDGGKTMQNERKKKKSGERKHQYAHHIKKIQFYISSVLQKSTCFMSHSPHL